eukprot:1141544-Pelagomonas_calceolata.AAC.1
MEASPSLACVILFMAVLQKQNHKLQTRVTRVTSCKQKSCSGSLGNYQTWTPNLALRNWGLHWEVCSGKVKPKEGLTFCCILISERAMNRMTRASEGLASMQCFCPLLQHFMAQHYQLSHAEKRKQNI